jgi:histidinol dehydrogenase
MRIVRSSDRAGVDELLSAARVRDRETAARAQGIVERVRREGDAALIAFARELDGVTGAIEIPRGQWDRRAASAPAEVRRALRTAARHIRRVAKAQLPRGFRVRVAPGIEVEQRVVPLDRVGCYVPGGRHPLPSSLLMTAIPARAAGVGEVIVLCPRVDATVVAAAVEAGVDRLFQVGGAHAIAAMAYGTKTIPRVDKIVGPGNRWVSAAKEIVAGDCAIDFYAGPTEILIVSDAAPAEWLAADLIAQAEHDPDARAVLLTSSRTLATRVAACIEATAPSSGPAREALARHGAIIVSRSKDESMALANAAAPEHLVVDDESMARRARAAGAIFIGRWTAQVAGDYAIGSNHVLPTAGAARFRGGLNAADFVRLISVQRVSRQGLTRLAPTVTALARAEGLTAHAASIEVRMGSRVRRAPL